MQILRLSLLLMLMASITACSNSAPSIAQPILKRSANLHLWILNSDGTKTGVASRIESVDPLEAGLYLSWSTAPPTPGKGKPMISKFEIDFGNGMGWQDVTAEARGWDFGGIDAGPDVTSWTHHVYSEPGTYVIKGRLTYWDGDVHLSSDLNESVPVFGDKTIIILPPE